MPIFLQANDVYRMIQRELPPDGVYPDGPPSGFFSTSDSMATAQVISDYYEVQENTYENYFPNIAVDRLPDFETMYFGYTLDQSLTIDEQRALLLAKIRTQPSPRSVDILAAIYTVLPADVYVELACPCGISGWMLDVSRLDIETYLNEFNLLNRTGPDLCGLTAADYGLTDAEFARYQAQAYTYYVYIYGYTLTAQQRSQLDQVLSAQEPARSTHIIEDGLDPANEIGSQTC